MKDILSILITMFQKSHHWSVVKGMGRRTMSNFCRCIRPSRRNWLRSNHRKKLKRNQSQKSRRNQRARNQHQQKPSPVTNLHPENQRRKWWLTSLEKWLKKRCTWFCSLCLNHHAGWSRNIKWSSWIYSRFYFVLWI